MANFRARVFALAGGAALAATMLVTPTTANAVGAVADAAQFHTSPAQAVVCWVGNVCTGATGAYTFQTAPGSCSGVDDTKTATCSVVSSGRFTNIVCGTGSVIAGSSSATITENDGDTVTISGLGITFVAGFGVSTGNATETGPGGSSASGKGVVQISPSGGTLGGKIDPPNKNAAGDGVCTPGFTVLGVTAAKV